MYLNTVPVSEISKEVGVTTERIRRCLKMHNVAVLSKSEFCVLLNKKRASFADELIIDYNNRVPLSEIGKKYNIGVAKVRKVITHEGLPLRTRAETLIEAFKNGERKITYNRSGTKNIFGRTINQWKGGAKLRGYPFELDKNYLQELFEKQNGKCAYTGLELVSPTTLKDRKLNVGNPKMISLDRIDSDFGYVKGNVQFVCNWINKGKGNMKHDSFKNVIEELKLSLKNN